VAGAALLEALACLGSVAIDAGSWRRAQWRLTDWLVSRDVGAARDGGTLMRDAKELWAESGIRRRSCTMRVRVDEREDESSKAA